MMDSGLRLLNILFLNGNMFKNFIMSCSRDVVNNFVNFL